MLEGSIIKYDEPIGKLKIMDMIVYFDEPRFYLGMNDNKQFFIYYQLSEYDSKNGYEEVLLGELTHFQYEQFINGEISTLNIFKEAKLFKVKDNYKKLYDFSDVIFDDFDLNVLPSQGYYYDRRKGLFS